MSKIPGPEFGYVDILDHTTKESNQFEEDKIKAGENLPSVLRPSAAGKCTRELAYGLMEQTQQSYYEKDIREPNVTRLLSIGHAIEPDVIEHFKKYTNDYFKLVYEQHSVLGFDVNIGKLKGVASTIEGSLDWVFLSEDGKGLIDLKTKKDKFHRHYTTDWQATTDKLAKMKTVKLISDSDKAFWIEDVEAFLVELKDPFFEQNFWQLNFYANTDWALRKGIDHASIIQYNKNDSRLREIRFKPSPALYKRTQEKFQSALDAANKGKPKTAPRDFNYGNIKCAFCPYKADCWKSKKGDAKQAYFDMNFPKKTWPKDTDKFTKKLEKVLETSYTAFIQGTKSNEQVKDAELKILEIMIDQDLKKIKFKDGHVYEKKWLKTPRGHFELRRSKL